MAMEWWEVRRKF